MSPTVLYIAGYGRSGSTVLDMLLGTHPRIIGGGELTHLFHHSLAALIWPLARRYSYW